MKRGVKRVIKERFRIKWKDLRKGGEGQVIGLHGMDYVSRIGLFKEILRCGVGTHLEQLLRAGGILKGNSQCF